MSFNIILCAYVYNLSLNYIFIQIRMKKLKKVKKKQWIFLNLISLIFSKTKLVVKNFSNLIFKEIFYIVVNIWKNKTNTSLFSLTLKKLIHYQIHWEHS